jgi:hypothetical protein
MSLKIKEYEEVNRSAIRVGSSAIREVSPEFKAPKESESSRIR